MLFMPGRELGELVVAEVGLAGAGGDDQRVVRRDGLAAEHVRGDGAGLEVDAGDLAEQDPGVVLPLSTSRVGGAISPSDRMPVATW